MAQTAPQSEPEPAADAQPAEAAAGAQPAEASGPESAGPSAPEDLRQRVAQLEAELAKTTDRMLRAQAELDNYRKRAAREREHERRYAALPLLRDLVGVLDHLELAVASAKEHENGQALLEGVALVADQLRAVLAQHGCRPIEAAGQAFDPNYHEAVAYEPSSEHPAGQVTRVARTGYRLYDRVVRPSQVHVSAGPPAADQAADRGEPEAAETGGHAPAEED